MCIIHHFCFLDWSISPKCYVFINIFGLVHPYSCAHISTFSSFWWFWPVRECFVQRRSIFVPWLIARWKAIANCCFLPSTFSSPYLPSICDRYTISSLFFAFKLVKIWPSRPKKKFFVFLSNDFFSINKTWLEFLIWIEMLKIISPSAGGRSIWCFICFRRTATKGDAHVAHMTTGPRNSDSSLNLTVRSYLNHTSKWNLRARWIISAKWS